jgi:mRNA interferase MazF
MPSMTAYSFGDVVLIQLPFTEQLSTKQWPAIVISSECYNTERADVIIMPVTGQMREARGYAEHLLADWRFAGLLKPSVIKPLIATVGCRTRIARWMNLRDQSTGRS